MLYSRRISIRPPMANVSDIDFENLTRECDYFFMISMDTTPLLYSAFYPLERIKEQVVPVFISHYRNRVGEDLVVTILAKRQ